MIPERYIVTGARVDEDTGKRIDGAPPAKGYYVAGRQGESYIAEVTDIPFAELDFVPVDPETIKPLPVKVEKYDKETLTALCPGCQTLVKGYDYCRYCGQRLGWTMEQSFYEALHSLVVFEEETSLLYPWAMPSEEILQHSLEIEKECHGVTDTDTLRFAIDKICGVNPKIESKGDGDDGKACIAPQI